MPGGDTKTGCGCMSPPASARMYTDAQLVMLLELHEGDLMHIPPLEWHVFGYKEGGYLDALCIYGQVTNIRPEEIQAENV